MKILMIILMMVSFNLSAEEEEESEALRALRLSCEKDKVALGCYNYANLLLSQKKENSDNIFKLGCDLGHQDSCSKKTWESITNAPASDSDSTPVAVEQTPAATETVEAATTAVAEEAPTPVAEESHSPASEEATASVEEPAQVEEAPKAQETLSEDTELDLSAIE